MKHVLIIGKHGYIGRAFFRYLQKWPDIYAVECVDSRDESWRECDFSKYDVVCMAAGIAHVKENSTNLELFYSVNRDLAFEIAKAAKGAGVSQYIYLSSMSVYGLTEGVINRDTPINPDGSYALSKAQAESYLETLRSPGFCISILRVPMVYGRGCKGNFRTVEKLALNFPFFPKVKNQRSMIYIDNLSEFMKIAVDRCLDGIYFPQNKEYVCTYEMARLIAKENGKRLFSGYITGLGVLLAMTFSKLLKKAFGTLIYCDTETLGFEYCLLDFEESIHAMYTSENQQ